MFSGPGRFDGCVQREQIGLLREVVDYLDNLSNVVGALSQCPNDFSGTCYGDIDAVQSIGCLLHGGNAAMHFFPRAVRDIEQHFGGIGHALNGCHHLINRS
jgi:hypothetical protein